MKDLSQYLFIKDLSQCKGQFNTLKRIIQDTETLPRFAMYCNHLLYEIPRLILFSIDRCI